MDIRSSSVRTGALASVCLLAAVDLVAAQPIRVRVYVRDEVGCSPPCTNPPAPLYCESSYFANITIIVQGIGPCTEQINIWATDGVSGVGPVVLGLAVGVSAPPDLKVLIAPGTATAQFPQAGEPMTVACGNFAGFNIDPALQPIIRLAGHIGGSLAGTQSVIVGSLYRLDVDGAIQRPIQADQPGAGLFRVFGGSSTSLGSITCLSGNIGRVQMVGDIVGNISAPGGTVANVISDSGNLRGNVTARDGITNVDVFGAIATAAPGPVTIDTTGNSAGIVTIKGASINANIDAGNPPPFRGNIQQVRATSGSLSGSITALNLTGTAVGVPGMEIAGSFTTGSTIALASGGLQRSIIINGGNGSGTWTGAVTVGTTVLSPLPSYDNTSSSIGGGAVGRAPFLMHANDCVPVHDTAVLVSFTQATIRHYGPVFWDTGGAKPYRAYVVELDDGQWPTNPVWTEITPDFDYALASNGRDVVVTAAENPGMDFGYGVGYKFEPMRDASPPNGTTKLKCANVTGTPVVGVYEYKFRVLIP